MNADRAEAGSGAPRRPPTQIRRRRRAPRGERGAADREGDRVPAQGEGDSGWRELALGSHRPCRRAGLFVLVALVLVDTIVWGEGASPARSSSSRPRSSRTGSAVRSGTGTAFAGTLDDEWSELAPAQQAEAADALVAALRERGVREIMVYDGEHRLRIQALGSQPARSSVRPPLFERARAPNGAASTRRERRARTRAAMSTRVRGR